MRKNAIKDYTIKEIDSLCIGYGSDFHVRDLIRNEDPDVEIIEEDGNEDEELYFAKLNCKDGQIKISIYSNNAWTDMTNANGYESLADICDDWDDNDLPEIIKENRN